MPRSPAVIVPRGKGQRHGNRLARFIGLFNLPSQGRSVNGPRWPCPSHRRGLCICGARSGAQLPPQPRWGKPSSCGGDRSPPPLPPPPAGPPLCSRGDASHPAPLLPLRWLPAPAHPPWTPTSPGVPSLARCQDRNSFSFELNGDRGVAVTSHFRRGGCVPVIRGASRLPCSRSFSRFASPGAGWDELGLRVPVTSVLVPLVTPGEGTARSGARSGERSGLRGGLLRGRL